MYRGYTVDIHGLRDVGITGVGVENLETGA